MTDLVQAVLLADLKPAPWNPRTIRDERFKNLCRSVEADPEFLWRRPILAMGDGTIYAGNMRYRAAAHLGMVTVPAIVEDVPEQLAKERALRDNAQWGDWHEDQLAEMVYGLKADGADIELLGIEPDELVRLLASVGVGAEELGDPDAVPQAPLEPMTKPGDLWLLGEHRVLCGDSTNAADVARLMGANEAGAVITDSPYGIEHEGIANDDEAGLRELFDGCLAVLPARNAVVMNFQSPRLFPVWLDAVRRAGQHFERALWMYKPNDATTFPWRGWLMTSEIVLISSIGQPKWKKPSEYLHDCITVQLGGAKEVDGKHTTPKPIAAVTSLVDNTEGDVYDPFLGSGTTVIACEQLGRRCYGMEIDPRYVDVIVKRWEDFTGRKAVLDGGR